MDDIKSIVRQYHSDSKQDFETATSFYNYKLYHKTLFFCHLSIENALKAAVIKKTGLTIVPGAYTLSSLVHQHGFAIPQHLLEDLDQISTFNITENDERHKAFRETKATEANARKYIADI